MGKFKNLLTSSSGIGLLFVALIAFNIIANKLYVRADLTEDNIYSLSEGTENIVAKLNQDVTIQFYFSRSLKDAPVMIKTYASRVEEVLREYAAISGGSIVVETLDPKPDSDEEVWARRYGVQGVRMPAGTELYFGAAFLFGDKDIAIPYFDPRREEFLEYDISEALMQAQTTDKMKVGVVSSLGVMGGGGNPMAGPQGGSEPWAFVEQLTRNSEVVEVKLADGVVAADVDVLVLLHAKGIDEVASYALDQFVLRGGRLIVAVDPLSRIDLQKMAMFRQQGQMPDASSDLPKLFKAWGVAYNKTEVVGDLRYTVRVNAGGAVVPYPFWMSLSNEVFSKENQITSKLNQMLVAESGGFVLDASKGYKFENLITTSKQSGVASAQLATFMGPGDFARELKEDDKEHIISGLLSGKFKSAFPSGAPAVPDDKQDKIKFGTHIAEAAEEGVILLIADTDFISDGNSVEKIRFGSQVILRPRNDNLSFMSNAIEFLGGSVDLISIRSRGRIARPFTKVQEIQVAAQQRYKEEEAQLSQQISELQKKLNEMSKERSSGNRYSLSQQQMAEVENFRAQEKRARERRREVRKNLREDIESLGRVLIATNMLVMPLGIGIFGFGVFLRRSRRRKKRR